MNIHNTSAASAATTSGTGLYLSVAQVAERYGISTDTVWRWSRNGDMPNRMRKTPVSIPGRPRAYAVKKLIIPDAAAGLEAA